MPKKLLPADAVSTLITERLHQWGRCIKKQRVAQNIRANDLCTRMGITHTTLRRIENGDPGAGAGLYLNALLILGLLDFAVPSLPAEFWEMTNPNSRARLPQTDDGDDF